MEGGCGIKSSLGWLVTCHKIKYIIICLHVGAGGVAVVLEN